MLCLYCVTSSGEYIEQGVRIRHLSPQHKEVVQNWLASKPHLRLATEADCVDCDEEIAELRRGAGSIWKPVPDYNPYYAVGDFNSDSNEDFAVALVDKQKAAKQFAIVVFNGPFPNLKRKAPSFFGENIDLSHGGMFFGSPRPKPYRLTVGPFESDSGFLLIPRGKGYIIK